MTPRSTTSALLLVAGVGAFLGSGCSGGINDPTYCRGGGGTFTVGPTTSPRFSWQSSDCLVSLLSVTHDSQGTLLFDWSVESTGGYETNKIASPIRYATVPHRAVQLVAPQPLRAGQAYTVYLMAWQFDEDAGIMDLVTIGLRTFTP